VENPLAGLGPDAAARLAVALVTTVVAYELLRFALLGSIRKYLQARLRRFLDLNRVRIDPFKFSGRQLVREELLADVEVQEQMLAAAKNGESLDHARARAEEYIDEICPRFSLTAYFQFGLAVANASLRVAYRVFPVKETFARLESVPKDASVMFVMKHRLNADYVLVAVALAGGVAISFAIGEWARVFPLDLLFKLFGGYFIRRNFRDPLYHVVLRRYLQLLVRRGVTQGVFPEGKLSRDGVPNDPKIGLLDGMVALAAEKGFEKPIVFVPVGLNFDRVLEDRILTRETDRTRAPGRAEKVRSAMKFLFRLPAQLAAFIGRLVTRRLGRFGYATLAVGEPISLDDFAKTVGHTGRSLAALPKEERRPLVKALADALMVRVGKVTPATPVTLTCRALLELGRPATAEEVSREVARIAGLLRGQGVPVVFGRERERVETARQALSDARESGSVRPEMANLEEQLLAHEEADECVSIGLARLVERGIVTVDAGRYTLPAAERVLGRYYGNSLATLPPVPA